MVNILDFVIDAQKRREKRGREVLKVSRVMAHVMFIWRGREIVRRRYIFHFLYACLEPLVLWYFLGDWDDDALILPDCVISFLAIDAATSRASAAISEIVYANGCT